MVPPMESSLTSMRGRRFTLIYTPHKTIRVSLISFWPKRSSSCKEMIITHCWPPLGGKVASTFECKRPCDGRDDTSRKACEPSNRMLAIEQDTPTVPDELPALRKQQKQPDQRRNAKRYQKEPGRHLVLLFSFFFSHPAILREQNESSFEDCVKKLSVVLERCKGSFAPLCT